MADDQLLLLPWKTCMARGHVSLQHLLRMMMAEETLLRTPGEISGVRMMRYFPNVFPQLTQYDAIRSM